MPIIDGLEYIDSPKVSGSMDTTLDEISVINVPLSGRKKVGEGEYKRITRRDVIQKRAKIVLDVDLKKYNPYPETQNTQNQNIQNTQNQNKDKKQHTVIKGDTMWAIAKRYGKTLKELAALNPHIKNRMDTIYVGEKINLG